VKIAELKSQQAIALAKGDADLAAAWEQALQLKYIGQHLRFLACCTADREERETGGEDPEAGPGGPR